MELRAATTHDFEAVARLAPTRASGPLGEAEAFFPEQAQAGVHDRGVVARTSVVRELLQGDVHAERGTIGTVRMDGLHDVRDGEDAPPAGWNRA